MEIFYRLYNSSALEAPVQRQLRPKNTNGTRNIMKSKWILEGRNGHLGSMITFFGNAFNVQPQNT